MAPASLHDLKLVLDGYFPPSISLRRISYLLNTVISLGPLFQRHAKQKILPNHGNRRTGWLGSIQNITAGAFNPEAWPRTNIDWSTDYEKPDIEVQQQFLAGLENIYDILTSDDDGPNPAANSHHRLFEPSPLVLVTAVLHCRFCEIDGRPVLLRKESQKDVNVFGPDFRRTRAYLVVAMCPQCHAHYYPDIVTIRDEEPGSRSQYLLPDPEWIHLDRSNLWAHRNVALMQQSALKNLKATWQRFASFYNETFSPQYPWFTDENAQKLFSEHFARLLLDAHGRLEEFTTDAFASSTALVRAVLQEIGIGGGCVPGAKQHSCDECMRPKQNCQPDLQQDAEARFGAVLGVDNVHVPEIPPITEDNERPPNQSAGPQSEDQNDGPQSVTRAVVMDGKTLVHRICCVDDCRNPLENYRNGLFCAAHRAMNNICGLGPCRRPREEGSRACDLPQHQSWYQAYRQRFSRLSFGAVTRIIRRTVSTHYQRATGGNPPPAAAETGDDLDPALSLRAELPPGPFGEEGHAVKHRFRARTIYCVQTIQWACGTPIGWGKCYTAESLTQVYDILEVVFPPDDIIPRPSFIFYDNACKLLAFIVTNQVNSPWLATSRFLVDAWHYVNHSVTDILCKTWCNPSPQDGSQPDLVRQKTTEDGRSFQIRTYNTETAEQLNSWLTAFEGPLRQMTDYNFDFFMHSILYLYKEICEQRPRSSSEGGSGDEDAEA